jgi:hypothetical protein
VSSYDLINPGGYYSARVRVLGSFHPVLSQRSNQTDGQDIDDPLYGNIGGQQEQVRSWTCLFLVCCALCCSPARWGEVNLINFHVLEL